MAYAIDFDDDGTPVRWHTDGTGVRAVRDETYCPALYAGARNDRTRYLDWLADALADDPKVVSVERERRRRRLRADPSPVLRIAVERIDDVRQCAREIRVREQDAHAPGVLALYDVDLDPGFRYCLDTGRDPLPDRPLRRLSLSLPDRALAAGDLSDLVLDGTPVERDPIPAVQQALATRDPDVLVVSSGDLVPLLADRGVTLGRESLASPNYDGGYRQLAGESTYASYGRVGHSPARYDVPGRVIVDRSNSFLLDESGFAGLEYFVDRAGKPLQELARDSIGGVLTAMEIREARERSVLAPWQKRQTEGWKSVETLRRADRGGTTLQPSVGVHEDVFELDFASLYPNVIREYNVSPDTVCCDCHDTDDVPELDYSICDSRGFLADVLGPLLDDRQRWKRRLRSGSVPDDERAALAATVDAVKWVLVSCFGYQGYRHAKYGRIEVHEAINAYAREILLDAKAAFEDAGWRVVHGIVDSLWVTADPDRAQRPVADVAREVSDAVGIELEREGRFDWVAFCPRKRASGGALMRYFGRWADNAGESDESEAEVEAEAKADSNRYKLRGIEARQRSTCTFVADAQLDLIDRFHRERTPEAVCERLQVHLARLRRGTVPAVDLTIRQRVSKRADEYAQSTRAKAALERYAEQGIDRHPGQSVQYVVADDDATGPDRVRLAFEIGSDGEAQSTRCDVDFYADRLVRACESVVAPLGWDETRVRHYLRSERDATLSSFR